jgi:enamine deaminase RidA (YjgF/YER057c/UK114 family)
MRCKPINAPAAPASSRGYAQAMEVQGATRLLFISGQIPMAPDGTVPATFADQCRLVWTNIDHQLTAAGMTLDNLVKITTFLSSRAYAAENSAVREAVLGSRTPALTVIITGIFDETWLVEIEAIAAS